MSFSKDNEQATLRAMIDMFEEWKPFPKDKVERSIEKKEKSDDSYVKRKAHVQKAVKNYKTRSTDFHKADQKFTGSDREPNRDKEQEHRDKAWKHSDKAMERYAKADAAGEKGNTKKQAKHGAKGDEQRDKTNKHAKKSAAMQAVRRSSDRATRAEDRKQVEVNKKSKADRATAKGMMDRAKLEKAAGTKPKRERMKVKAQDRPGIIKKPKKRTDESLDFTDFVKSMMSPLYEKEGEIPKCPPGYKFDKKQMMCVPKSEKDSVSNRQGSKDLKPGNGAGYNTWGPSGMNGDGYAWEEQPTSNDAAGGE